jgi:hypothetical protein
VQSFPDETADQGGLGLALLGGQLRQRVVEVFIDHDLQALHEHTMLM